MGDQSFKWKKRVEKNKSVGEILFFNKNDY
jgi:hypothetical protein